MSSDRGTENLEDDITVKELPNLMGKHIQTTHTYTIHPHMLYTHTQYTYTAHTYTTHIQCIHIYNTHTYMIHTHTPRVTRRTRTWLIKKRTGTEDREEGAIINTQAEKLSRH